MDKAREILTAAMERDRKRLGLEWTDVARLAGMTPQNLLRIRNGEIKSLSDNAKRGIETAFRWPEGSVDKILMGGEPPRVDYKQLAPRGEDEVLSAFLSRLRERIVTMSSAELMELLELFPDIPDAERYQLLRRVTRLRTQKGEQPTQGGDHRKSN